MASHGLVPLLSDSPKFHKSLAQSKKNFEIKIEQFEKEIEKQKRKKLFYQNSSASKVKNEPNFSQHNVIDDNNYKTPGFSDAQQNLPDSNSDYEFGDTKLEMERSDSDKIIEQVK